MSDRGKGGCMYGGSLLKKCFFLIITPLQNSLPSKFFPLFTIILQAVRFSFPTQTEIRKLGHIGGRLHKIVLKTGAG